MTDAFDLPPGMRRFIQDTARAMAALPPFPPIPPEVVRALQALQPHMASVRAAVDQMAAFNSTAGIDARQRAAFAEMAASFTATHQLPVPTADDLVETDEALRTRVVPETSEEELEKAVSEIPADPKKVELAALLTRLIDQATGVRGSTPWVVFVVAFWVAMTMNPDVVGALALAYAVALGMKSSG